MAAHVYPYNRMPPAPLAGPSKRYPLNTVNNNYGPIPTMKPPISPKPTDRQLKPPASPPLARQNSKTVPPSPPRIITDKAGKSFQRIGFLGEVRRLCSHICACSHSNLRVGSRECMRSRTARARSWRAKSSPRTRSRRKRPRPRCVCPCMLCHL